LFVEPVGIQQGAIPGTWVGGVAAMVGPSNRVICLLCGQMRNKLPNSWITNDCQTYCSKCWDTVACKKCSHHDPKGRMRGGRWQCRGCLHKQSSSDRSAFDQEMYHKLVIDDQNGEEFEGASLKASRRQESPTPIEQSFECVAEDEDEAEDCDEDDLAPLRCPGGVGQVAALRIRETARSSHLVLLLDASGSMRTVDVVRDVKKSIYEGDDGPAVVSRLDAAVECAAKFVEQHARSHPRDVFSIATFADTADVVSRLADVPTTKEALQQMAVRGANGTHYRAAIECAVELLALRPGVPAHVLILSDGRPADTKVALQLFQNEFLKDGNQSVRVHGIGFGSFVESFVALQQLACLTSGSFALSGCSVRGLCDAFSSVSSTITASTLSSRSERSNEPGQASAVRTLRKAEYEQPDLGMFGKKGVLRFSATRSTFRYDGTEFHEQQWRASPVARRIQPHMRGGMRLVYSFRDEQVTVGEVDWMVAKCSRFLNEALNTRTIVETHAKSSAVARYYAAHFNKQLRISGKTMASIFFVPCFVYEATDQLALEEANVFAAERYLPGVFLKYNSNNGYVSEGFMKHQDVMQAFTHFTFDASEGQMMVADLQGVARDAEAILTDPQVLSLDGRFGPGDLAASGMRACLAAHRCGPACRALGLKPVDASILRKLGSVRRVARSSRSASDHSAAWERLSEPGLEGSDWDRVSERNLEVYAMSEGGRSSQMSASSWVYLLDS